VLLICFCQLTLRSSSPNRRDSKAPEPRKVQGPSLQRTDWPFYNFAGGYNPWYLYDSTVSDMLNIPRAITKENRIFGAPEISKQANTYIGGPLSREQMELTLVLARMMERLDTTMTPLFCTATRLGHGYARLWKTGA
jgi:hypothetical protein